MLINGMESIFSFNATVNRSILLLLAARERLMFGGANPLPVVNNNLTFGNCGKNKMQSARTSSPVYGDMLYHTTTPGLLSVNDGVKFWERCL